MTGVDHIGILVRDIDASLPYYTGELGFALLSDERVEAVGVRLALLDAGNARVQLVSPLRDGPIANHLQTFGEGLHHICFAVEDIARAVQALAPNAGVAINRGGQNRLTAFLPHRPNNLAIELIQAEERGS